MFGKKKPTIIEDAGILQKDLTDEQRIDNLFRQNNSILDMIQKQSESILLLHQNNDLIAKQLVVFKEILQYMFQTYDHTNDKKLTELLEKLETMKGWEVK